MEPAMGHFSSLKNKHSRLEDEIFWCGGEDNSCDPNINLSIATCIHTNSVTALTLFYVIYLIFGSCSFIELCINYYDSYIQV